MTNFIVIKIKNFIYITAENKDKSYKFDINTGIFYGLSGKAIKRYPNGFCSWLENHYYENPILTLIYSIKTYWFCTCSAEDLLQYAEYFKVIDRLDAIGFTFKNAYSCSKNNLDLINKNFKAFVKYFKENPNATLDDYQEYFEETIFNEIMAKVEHITTEVKSLIWNNRYMFKPEQYPLVASYLARGVYDFFNCTIQTSAYQRDYESHAALSKIRDYFELCEKLNMKPEKGDFFRNYVNARRTYETNRISAENDKLIEVYNERPELNYENDTFKVILPTTREIFFNEGQNQRNCVYNYYFPKVVKKETYVVLIRRKTDLDKSYITCEVSRKGSIIQYLGFSNNSVKDEDALAFKNEYRQHLNNVWGKGV